MGVALVVGMNGNQNEKGNEMKKYMFKKGNELIEVEAANYNEALAKLVFVVGSEQEAAEYIFVG